MVSHEEPAENSSGPPKSDSSPAPVSIAFYCRVCDSRLSAHASDTGKRARCPDCGAINLVPRPPQARPKKPPPAMHGQQYGLWGVDEAPSTAELIARQPKFYPVHCRICDTLMHAQPKQAGKLLTCPDCGAKTMAPLPPVEKAKPSALVPDGAEYQLDETFPPEPRPAPGVMAASQEEQRLSLRDQLQEEYGEKPKLPRVPLVQGVLRMLLRSPVPTWWLTLSFFSALVAGLASFATQCMDASYFFTAICCLAGLCILSPLWFSAIAVLCCSILTDSSEGNDKLYNAPNAVFVDWVGHAVYLALAIGVSLAVGGVLGVPLALGPETMTVGFYLCFPVILLSMLEIGSPVGFLSIHVLESMFKRPSCWLLFYLVTAPLVAAVYFGTTMSTISTWWTVLVGPIGLAIAILYFRLLGRLGWWLAESLATEDTDDRQTSTD